MPTCRLSVKVTPSARRHEVRGWRQDELQVRVAASPVDGRANLALCHYLAEILDLPKSAITVRHGLASRQKVLEIQGADLAAIRACLAGASG